MPFASALEIEPLPGDRAIRQRIVVAKAPPTGLPGEPDWSEVIAQIKPWLALDQTVNRHRPALIIGTGMSIRNYRGTGFNDAWAEFREEQPAEVSTSFALQHTVDLGWHMDPVGDMSRLNDSTAFPTVGVINVEHFRAFVSDDAAWRVALSVLLRNHLAIRTEVWMQHTGLAEHFAHGDAWLWRTDKPDNEQLHEVVLLQHGDVRAFELPLMPPQYC
jgi:hypothetical protein